MSVERILSVVVFLCFCAGAFAQENWPTYISPNYYGPNALPVPNMLKGTSDRLDVRIDASGALGRTPSLESRTETIGYDIRIPLWTDRVNFSVWGQFWEWYQGTGEVREGSQFGDIYFSADAEVLKENERRPAIVLRAACKTASGEDKGNKRFYDSAAYFIDASAFKLFRMGGRHGISLALSTGFICWQVRQSRQNDAVMYGLSLGYACDGILTASADFGGYYGWRGDGDRPMTLKLKFDFIPDRVVSPFLEYQHGFKDWPYDSLKIGMKLSINILENN